MSKRKTRKKKVSIEDITLADMIRESDGQYMDYPCGKRYGGIKYDVKYDDRITRCCPSCGARGVLVSIDMTPECEDKVPLMFEVKCEKTNVAYCLGEGHHVATYDPSTTYSTFDTPEEAINAWNSGSIRDDTAEFYEHLLGEDNQNDD